MSAYAVSAVAGVPLGLWLASSFGFRAPFVSICGVALLLWVLAWRIVPTASAPAPHERSSAPLNQLLKEPGLLGGWLLTFLVVSAGFLMIPYLGTHFVSNLGVDSAQLGLVYLCGGACTFFTSRLIGEWVDRAGPSLVLTALLVASCVPHLLVTHLDRAPLAGVIASFVLFMTLTSGRMIPTMVLLTSRVPPRLRSRYLAVNTAISDGASGLGAWLAASLLTTSADGRLIGFGRVGILAVAVSLLALGVLGSLQRALREAT
jgi:MFS transporter, DHA1 family, inner membrane transport protein